MTHPLGTLIVASAGALAFGVAPYSAAAAPVTHYFGGAKDVVGDGPSPSLDIWSTLARYNSDGSVLFVVTMTGPIDTANAVAGVGVRIGSSCNKLLGIGAGQLSKTVVKFIPKAKEKLAARDGQGQVTNNVFTFLVKHPTLANWTPACYAVALVNPTDEKAAPYDQTDEIPMAAKS